MMTKDEMPGGKRIAELRQSIERAFPAKPYIGKIMPFDEKLDDPEMDEEKELYDALKGRKWTEVPKEILHNQPDAYVLLTDEAFTAFIAAWLMCSLEDMEGENEVRNFLVYAFSPKHDKLPDTTEFVRHQIRALNQEQRHTLRSILLEVAEREPSSFVKRLASEAVALIDTIGR
jgi:hypothetical protein